MDVVIRLGVRTEMHWPLLSIGNLKLNTSPYSYPSVSSTNCYLTPQLLSIITKYIFFYIGDIHSILHNEYVTKIYNFSTQLNEHLWTQVIKHLNVHIYLVTSVYQVLQSTWFAYWSVADSGQVSRKII